jgi:hypothetical protein
LIILTPPGHIERFTETWWALERIRDHSAIFNSLGAAERNAINYLIAAFAARVQYANHSQPTPPTTHHPEPTT